ncbi:MAG: right-handed parallel beta-helix repeat-containing protein [Burkholderiales bacterium]|nr:right-handed parallel beta-helix repeat-containing protein [Burkholderiales bacterium]MBZ0249770.1 right-handed parallel beta-helix repeat-containing protein [Burkholderiales bacterium]
MLARTAIGPVIVLLSTLVLPAAANAQLFRAYLAITGNDANPCTLPQPCRLLPAALAAVASGGEIWMLDSANYNTATVNLAKSVTILAVPGAVGSVVATGGPAISIATAGLTVTLRNLVIVPLPGAGATDGVRMTQASTLTIEDSLVANLPGQGVFANAGRLRIVDSAIRGNGIYAVLVQDGAQGVVSGTQVTDNVYGIAALGEANGTTTSVVVRDCLVTGGVIGVAALTTAAAGTRATVTRTTIEQTFYGVASQTSGGAGSSILIVSDSSVSNSSYAYYQDGAGSVLKSAGNNLFGDSGLAVGALTPIALQ